MALYQPYTGYVAPPAGPPAPGAISQIAQIAPPSDAQHGAPQSYGVPDAHNPAAVAFAVQRLHQLVAAHLLGGMPQNMSDPAAVWRGLSQGLGGNAQALAQFLAAGRHPQATAHAPQLVSENGRTNAVVGHLVNAYLGRH